MSGEHTKFVDNPDNNSFDAEDFLAGQLNPVINVLDLFMNPARMAATREQLDKIVCEEPEITEEAG